MKLKWDEPRVSYGVDHGVIYPVNAEACVWNGLSAVLTNPTNTESASYFQDGQKYNESNPKAGTDFMVKAYTYPDEIDVAGPIRLRGMSWRRQTNVAYELHILYNLTMRMRDKFYETESDSFQPTLFDWDATSRPSFSSAMQATSHITIMAERTTPELLSSLEDLLYGTDVLPPTLPTLDEIVSIFEKQTVFIIIDHGDGTWTAIAPDSWIDMVSPTEFLIRTPSAFFLNEEQYRIRSW